MTAQEMQPGKYRLRVQDFRLLDEAGAFGDGRTELIDGDVIVVSPEYRPHLFVKSELGFRLRMALAEIGSTLFVAIDGSVLLSDNDEPRPDIIVTSEPRGEGPVPVASVALLVEVADSSRSAEFGVKAPLYARHGIPEYWMVDVRGRMLHQMWSPGADGYGERREVALGERVEAVTIGGLQVDTSDI